MRPPLDKSALRQHKLRRWSCSCILAINRRSYSVVSQLLPCSVITLEHVGWVNGELFWFESTRNSAIKNLLVHTRRHGKPTRRLKRTRCNSRQAETLRSDTSPLQSNKRRRYNQTSEDASKWHVVTSIFEQPSGDAIIKTSEDASKWQAVTSIFKQTSADATKRFIADKIDYTSVAYTTWCVWSRNATELLIHACKYIKWCWCVAKGDCAYLDGLGVRFACGCVMWRCPWAAGRLNSEVV